MFPEDEPEAGAFSIFIQASNVNLSVSENVKLLLEGISINDEEPSKSKKVGSCDTNCGCN